MFRAIFFLFLVSCTQIPAPTPIEPTPTIVPTVVAPTPTATPSPELSLDPRFWERSFVVGTPVSFFGAASGIQTVSAKVDGWDIGESKVVDGKYTIKYTFTSPGTERKLLLLGDGTVRVEHAISVLPKVDPTPTGWVTFITDARRQTEQMPKQMYALLPSKIKANWGYVFCGEDIPPTKNIVLFANYTGFQDQNVYPDWAQQRHNNTLACIEGVLKKYPDRVVTLQVTQGDSTNRAFALEIRKKLQERQDALTDKYHIKRATITFGADEQATQAMAYSLGPVEVDIIISNPDAGQHYDGDRPAKELIAAKLDQIGLVQKAGAPFRILVLTRRPGGGIVDWQADDKVQQIFDKTFFEQNEVTPDTAIVDARLYNGAWDAGSAPKRCDYLAFGAWGTFGNSFGQTASIAKILYKLKADRKQFLLEAVAHDVFFQGYNEAQRRGMKTEIEKLGIGYQHYHEYSDAEMAKIKPVVNTWVNKRMKEHFAGTGCFDGKTVVINPQRGMLFEGTSEVALNQ